MHCHFDNPKAMPPVDFRRLAGGFHSFAKQASFCIASGMDFFDVRWILGSFWEAIASQTSVFGQVFGDVFFDRVFASILDTFLKARNVKNNNFPLGKQRFSQNRRFRKKCETLVMFDFIFESESDEKSISKHAHFFFVRHRFFIV